MFSCQIKTIDPVESVKIAKRVREDNVPTGLSVSHASLVNQKMWPIGGTIVIEFLNGTEEQINFFKKTVEEWLLYANLHFDYGSPGMVRVQFGPGGSWSYIGTDALGIQSGETMNFGWVDRSVILHEPGHMLGLLHSHNSINFPYHFNRDQVIKDLSGPPNNWSVDMIEFNVLDRTTEQVTELPWEPGNIMNYAMPASWIQEGVEIKPGNNIGVSEGQLIALKYPKSDSRKQVSVGIVATGSLPDSFDIVIDSAGLYGFKMLPRDLKSFIAGKRSTLQYLDKGIYSVELSGKGTYQFSIRRY